MGYRVSYKGLEVVVETLDEVDALFEKRSKADSGSGTLDLRLNGNDRKLDAQAITMKGLTNGLSLNAKKALKAIARSGGRMSDSDLAKAVHAKNNMALAGILSPLYKAARLAKANDLPVFFQKETTTNEGGQAVTEYCIPPEALSEVKEQLKL